jgi:hypothetical protein
MKRTVFVIPDGTYGGSWGASAATPGIKDRYYGRYELQYGVFNIAPDGPLTKRAREVMDLLSARIGTLGAPADRSLRQQGVADTLFFDLMHDELADAFRRFCRVRRADLVTTGNDRDRNAHTLRDLERICNVVSQ